MKVVFALFDSLNRLALQPYGGRAAATPNLRPPRPARRDLFDATTSAACRCMPARRDMQTGRLYFLHRSWGPLEPFDNAFPELLQRGRDLHRPDLRPLPLLAATAAPPTTPATTPSSSSAVRKSYPWKAMVQPPWERLREEYHALQFSDQRAQPTIPQQHRQPRAHGARTTTPSRRCAASTPRFEFLEYATAPPTAGSCTSRPSTRTSRSMRRSASSSSLPRPRRGPILDWPRYGRADKLPYRMRRRCAPTTAPCVALCDPLARPPARLCSTTTICGATPRYSSTSDHGYLLGEHDFGPRTVCTCYEEISPYPACSFTTRASPGQDGTRRQRTDPDDRPDARLSSTCSASSPQPRCEGLSLLPVAGARPGACARRALFGYFGGAVNLTDGRYTYFRYPADLATPGGLPVHRDADPPETRRSRPRSSAPAEPRPAVRLHQGRAAAESAGDRTLADVPQLRPRRVARQGHRAVRPRDRPRPARYLRRSGSGSPPRAPDDHADDCQRGPARSFPPTLASSRRPRRTPRNETFLSAKETWRQVDPQLRLQPCASRARSTAGSKLLQPIGYQSDQHH